MRINLNIKILLLISVILVSCVLFTTRKNKPDRSDLIPSRQLTDLITDLYLADGLVTQSAVRYWYTAKDSLGAYKDVIESHGYTLDDMNRTLKYYFVKNPKKLIKIYDEALARLSAMESEYEKEVSAIQAKVMNLWPGEKFYSLPVPDSVLTGFDIRFPYNNTYIFSFTAVVYPDDPSIKPHLEAYTCHPDSAETGKKHYVRAPEYIKDGQPHAYSFNVNAYTASNLRFRGNLFNPGFCSEISMNHVYFEKISLVATSGAQ